MSCIDYLASFRSRPPDEPDISSDYLFWVIAIHQPGILKTETIPVCNIIIICNLQSCSVPCSLW